MKNKIIVIDDDPTGSQTVHSCPLVTSWTPELLAAGLDDSSPLLFILSNTRALDPARATEVTREICLNLVRATAERNIEPLFVSRSDSTLRGHYPVETDVMAEELGPFDAHFLVPAFFEGGRITLEGVHYIETEGTLVRTDSTEFARDSVFGYSTSYLPDYVEEKTKGRIRADEVIRLPVLGSVGDYLQQMTSLEGNRCVAVDSSNYGELHIFAQALIRATAAGKRFLVRGAASIVSALAALPPQPLSPQEMSMLRRSTKPGMVIAGSHVKRTTEQLDSLLHEDGVVGIEFDVGGIRREQIDPTVESIVGRATAAHDLGRTPVIYTSRRERRFPTAVERLRFGETVSQALAQIVRRLPPETSFLISKGGITSNDVLSKGLGVGILRVVGQISSGCTVVTAPNTHRLSGLPVVIFPGNVGGPHTLRDVYRLLSGPVKE